MEPFEIEIDSSVFGESYKITGKFRMSVISNFLIETAFVKGFGGGSWCAMSGIGIEALYHWLKPEIIEGIDLMIEKDKADDKIRKMIAEEKIL